MEALRCLMARTGSGKVEAKGFGVRIDIPYTYEALVRCEGGKRERMVVLASAMQASVPARDEAEAPIVAIHRDAKGQERTTRWHDDGWLISTTPADRSPWLSYHHLAKPLSDEEAAKASVVRSFEGVSRDRLQAIAGRCIEVDGVLYVPSSEPVYIRDALGRVRSGLLGDEEGKTPAERIWRCDEESVLLNYLDRLAGAKADEAFDAAAIVVRRSDLLAWNRRRAIAMEAARAYCRSVQRRLEDAPGAAVMDWVALRDAIKSGSLEIALEAARRLEGVVAHPKTLASILVGQAAATSTMVARP